MKNSIKEPYDPEYDYETWEYEIEEGEEGEGIDLFEEYKRSSDDSDVSEYIFDDNERDKLTEDEEKKKKKKKKGLSKLLGVT